MYLRNFGGKILLLGKKIFCSRLAAIAPNTTTTTTTTAPLPWNLTLGPSCNLSIISILPLCNMHEGMLASMQEDASLSLRAFFSLTLTSSSLSESCRLENKIDYPGNDIRSSQVENFDACIKACLDEEKCAGTFTHQYCG